MKLGLLIYGASLVIVLGCSTGPDPDRLKPSPLIAAASSCTDVQDVMDGMDDGSLWSADLTIDEFALVWDRDIDNIKFSYERNCGPAFEECRHAARFDSEFNPEFMDPSMVIYYILAGEFLEDECY